jgi:hypothetical protein
MRSFGLIDTVRESIESDLQNDLTKNAVVRFYMLDRNSTIFRGASPTQCNIFGSSGTLEYRQLWHCYSSAL